MKRELLYLFFIECCKYTEDKFWKNVFEDLAYGITPYGTYINKDYLICNYKDKEFVYKIQKKDPKELFEEIYGIFKNKLSLMSKDEIIQKKDAVKTSTQDINYDSWCNIKKKNLKDIMIEKYAINMGKKHNLSLNQTKYLVSLIFLSFIFKVITSDDITMKDGYIESINGIEYENGKINVKNNIYDIQVNITPDIIINNSLMSDDWNKYLNNLRKIDV
jgi:hypothetical protein